MSDAPITPRSNAAVPDTTVPMATKPGPGAQPATAPMNARATQMSAAVGPGAPPPQSAAAPFVSEEISGVLIAQESTLREQAAREAALREAAAAARQAPSRRIGASTLESRLVPPPATAEDGSSAPLPPLPAVIDVGAPAHAFVAKSAHAPPPMPYGPGASMGRHGYPHGGHAHGPAPAGSPGGRASTSTSTMALVVVGVVVGLLAIAAVVLAIGFFAARRSATVNRPSRPSVATASPGAASEPAADAPGPAAPPLFPMGSAPPPAAAAGKPAGAAATQAPRPVRK